MTVLLWYLTEMSLEVEHFDDLNMAVGHAAWMLWESKGAPQLIEVGDRLIRDTELSEVIAAYETATEHPILVKDELIGRIKVRHPTEDMWTTFGVYADPGDMAEDVEWMRSIVGNARVAVVDP